MAKCDQIKVRYDEDERHWDWAGQIGDFGDSASVESNRVCPTKEEALRSARAFAAKFKVPPEVVVEGEEDGKA